MSQELFNNVVDMPLSIKHDQPVRKKSRFMDDSDSDGIMALLDEIDAAAAMDSSSMCSMPVNQRTLTDPFNAPVLQPSCPYIKPIEPKSDNIDSRSINVPINNSQIIKDRLYLPDPFTNENVNADVLLSNVQKLSLQVPAVNKDKEPHKIARLIAYIIEYERIGQNYRVSLTTPTGHNLSGTIMNSVFSDDQCHYGMLLCCRNVTSYQEHLIITSRNIDSIYCNHHLIG